MKRRGLTTGLQGRYSLRLDSTEPAKRLASSSIKSSSRIDCIAAWNSCSRLPARRLEASVASSADVRTEFRSMCSPPL
nr:MAG TPA: hypothetical protein [Caudoviricetes sp.]